MMHCFVRFKITTTVSSKQTAVVVIWIHSYYSIHWNTYCAVLTAIIDLASRKSSREGMRCWRGVREAPVILSAQQAASDLSGLREERRASLVPCDPRLCFMVCA